MTTKDWAQKYLDEGWSPVPFSKGEKGPRGQHMADWETASYTPADFDDDGNIGVHLGRHSNGPGLYDVDLDAKEAAVAADILLPPTDRIHGRPSKPRSHRFYTCDEVIEYFIVYGLGGTNDTLVELRGQRPSTGKCTQTMVPPSVHPHGETLAWDNEGRPCHLPTGAPLVRCVRNLAVAILLARGFPGAGHRHTPRLALAGFLKRAGLEDVEVLAVGEAIMAMVGGDKDDWRTTARTTLAKLASDPDAKVTGGPQLREALTDGDRVLKLVNKLLGRAEQAAVDEVIDSFNKRYFLVMAGVTPCVADDADPAGIKLLTYDAFRKKYVKQFMPVRQVNVAKKGQPAQLVNKKGRPQADVWLEHPQGRQFESLVYAPPGAPVAAGPRDYNGWRGFAVEPAAGDWRLLDHHLRHIVCAGNEDHYAWLLNWCAALFQQPGRHASTAILLMGGQGAGKGLVAHDLLGRTFDRRHYLTVASSEQFYGRFAGELLSGKCLVFLDEATWGGDKRDMGQLKGRITGDYLTVDRKNIAAVMEPSMLHLILASNEDWPVGLDADDRRITAFKLNNPRTNDPSYFGPLYQELDHEGGRAAFLEAMLRWPLDEQLLRTTLVTGAKTDLKVRSLPAEASWWQNCLAEGRVLEHEKTWPSALVRSSVHQAYLTFVQLLGETRRLAPVALGKKLRKFCPSVSHRKPHGKPREYVFPTLDVARSEFETYLRGSINWDSSEDAPEVDDSEF